MRNIIMKLVASAIGICCILYAADAQQSIPSPKKNEVTIGNTRISREEQELVVDYQIALGDNVLSCDVEVVLNVDGRPMKNYSAEYLTGDYGKIVSSGNKQIRFNVEKSKHALADKSITFTLNVRNKDVLDSKILAMASVSVFPQMSYGAMLGYVKKVGGYAKFRSDFSKVASEYACTSDGSIEGGVIWTSGKEMKTRMQATLGILFRLSNNVYPYFGGGYGTRTVYWEDFKGNWALVKDYSCEGIAAETGIIFKFGPVAISTGVSTTAFRYSEVEVGIGVMF